MKAQMAHLVSMTEAYRAKEVLKKYCHSLSMIPTPGRLNPKGCGYSLVCKDGPGPRELQALLQQASIRMIPSQPQ